MPHLNTWSPDKETPGESMKNNSRKNASSWSETNPFLKIDKSKYPTSKHGKVTPPVTIKKRITVLD